MKERSGATRSRIRGLPDGAPELIRDLTSNLESVTGQRVSRHELGASPVSRLNARLKASSES